MPIPSKHYPQQYLLLLVGTNIGISTCVPTVSFFQAWLFFQTLWRGYWTQYSHLVLVCAVCCASVAELDSCYGQTGLAGDFREVDEVEHHFDGDLACRVSYLKFDRSDLNANVRHPASLLCSRVGSTHWPSYCDLVIESFIPSKLIRATTAGLGLTGI